MLSTQRHSGRGSGDNGGEYSRRDRQRIAAATDAAIADVRAMGPSPFATGHQPNTQDTESRPDTGHRGQAAATSSSPSTSWINPKKTKKKKKPKKRMGNKAFMLSHSWGGPIQGGVTDAVHLLIRLLHALGLAVYCTTLTATEEEIKEAREYGVELIAPSPLPKFKSRGELPNADWLYRHDDYFPNLEELANVRFVFGFGMINSDAAFKIVKNVFSRSAFYLINLFDKDLITPVIANCVDSELNFRRKELSRESEKATSVFSVGSSIFNNYKTIYRKAQNIKHFQLSPMVNENDFKILSPQPVNEGDEFQVLSLFQEDELENLKSNSVIVQAMNSVAELFYQHGKKPPKWKILGVSKRSESDLIETLNPHSKLKIILRRMPSAEELNDELEQSHLVLVPPSSVHYVNLTLAAMCAAVPIIIPWGSQSHELIKGHLSERHAQWLVVDASKSKALKECIMKFLCNYGTALKTATDIKTVIKSKVKQELENINNDFLKVLKDDAEIKYGATLKREKIPAGKTKVHGIDKGKNETGHHKISRKRKLEERETGDVDVKVRVSEVVPESGRTVEEVERDFYGSDEVKEKTEEVGQLLDEQHDEMKVRQTGHKSISYTMSCQSLDALECLKGKYENGKLQDMMENKFLAGELLDKIGAFYLAVDVTIDYEEYFLCRKELIQKYGLLPQDAEQQIDADSAISTEPQKSCSVPRRQNRARDFLKAFQTEGDKVTESQINMLDQL
ncbi:uncharacterized protein [Ptychodera flava]|uniref:uncharacterized protein n=1 Tax=Ptychodera flava TaxID=63121 RepID=UPI00396A6801